MASRRSRGPWHAVIRKTRAGHSALQVCNTKGTIAVVYTTEADARLLAASLNLLGSLKHMVAIVLLREGDLRASEKAKYDAARALVNELNGEH